MIQQGPPQIPPNLEKVEFKIFRPGDFRSLTNRQGKPIDYVIPDKKRLITLGEDAFIDLKELGGYFLINKIENNGVRKNGIGRSLYEKALDLAKIEGKKGLISSPSPRDRTGHSDRMWEFFKKDGRVSIVTIEEHQYEALLC